MLYLPGSSASSSWDRVTCAEGSLLARTPVWTGSGVLGTPKALMNVGAGCLWTSGGALPAACSVLRLPWQTPARATPAARPSRCRAPEQAQQADNEVPSATQVSGLGAQGTEL